MNKKVSMGVGIAIVAIMFAITFNFSIGGANAKYAKWQKVGKLGFSAGTAENVSFAFNPKTKKPYVAFLDSRNSYKVTVMKFNGKKWLTVGSAFNERTTGSADKVPLAFHPTTGEPYVAFRDNANSGKLTVKKFNGASWEIVGSAGFTQSNGLDPDLAFNISTGEPYVAFMDDYNGFQTSVMKYDGISWDYVGAAGFSNGYGVIPSLAFDASNVPYVAFRDDSQSSKATVMKYNGSTWENIGSPGFSADLVAAISLAFNPSTNLPYVSYVDYGNDEKLTVMKFDGAQWSAVGLSSTVTNRAVMYPSLAFNPKNSQPYIAFRYRDRSYQSTVINFNGTNWKTVGKSFNPQGADYISIAFSPGSNAPYVAFGDLGKSRKVSVKKYSK